MVTFRFDKEYDFDYEYDFLNNQILDKIVVRSNPVVVLLFATRIAEDLVVNITTSKSKKSYS